MIDGASGVKEVVKSLKQLIFNTTHKLQEANSFGSIDHHLQTLEESDTDFHRYDLVKKIHSHIEEQLSGLVQDEINLHTLSPTLDPIDQNGLVQKISNKIKNTTEFINLNKAVCESVHNASEHLMKNFEEEIHAEAIHQHDTFESGSPHKNSLMFSDEESSFGESSLNQSTYLFMTREQLQSIAQALYKTNNLKSREDALKQILHIPALDVYNSDVWVTMKKGLIGCLSESDEQLWIPSLNFFARGLSTNNPATKEFYDTLVEYIKDQYNNRKGIPHLKEGLDIQTYLKLIKLFRLINQFQRFCPNYWIRYPDRFLVDVLKSILGLLSINESLTGVSASLLSPLHLLSLVDIKAEWFTRWTHGHYSRNPFLKYLSQNNSLIELSVRSVLDFNVSLNSQKELVSEISSTFNNLSVNIKKKIYSTAELEYSMLIHSLHLLGQLIKYENGRAFFPIEVKSHNSQISLTKFLIVLIQIMLNPALNRPLKLSTASFDPRNIVGDIFRKLCISETICSRCICLDEIIAELIAPINQISEGNRQPQIIDGTLLLLADILSIIASTHCGRQQLLYGQNGERFTKSKLSASYVLTKFAKKVVSTQLNSTEPVYPSLAVAGNFVFVCRQLYSMCEGLLSLQSFNLHLSIAKAWKSARMEMERSSTPTPVNHEIDQSQYTAIWEDILLDNLLNFAGTPKGVLLLQLTGTMDECVQYMHSRYARKLQVSRREKFGYGYMMSQIVSTVPGIKALLKTDFVGDLISRLWKTIEIRDDNHANSASSIFVNTSDKIIRKHFLTLVNILSSFYVVYEVFGELTLPPSKEIYTYKDVPSSLLSLIDRLVLSDNPNRLNSFFNFEQSHIFGLQLLSVLTSCLNTQLFFVTQFNFQEILLKSQLENVTGGSNKIIIDPLSVERNYILVKTKIVGGPTERNLPARTLNKSGDFNNTLFSKYPVPNEYSPNMPIQSTVKQDIDLTDIESNLNESGLKLCQDKLNKILSGKMETSQILSLCALLEVGVDILADLPEYAVFPSLECSGFESQIKSFKLSKLHEEGIELSISYGTHLRLLNNSHDTKERLQKLLKMVFMLFAAQKRQIKSQDFKILQANFIGFDWFLATIFLMMFGSEERAWGFVQKYSLLSISMYIWPHRSHISAHIPEALSLSGIPLIFSSICHNIELILQSELPQVHSAFKMSGFSPAQVCQQWLIQCFWNYFDWVDIVAYITICTLHGVDYQVYTCVAILHYLQDSILSHSQSQDLITFLKEEPIYGFKFGDHFGFMKKLELNYRRIILSDFQNLSKP